MDIRGQKCDMRKFTAHGFDIMLVKTYSDMKVHGYIDIPEDHPWYKQGMKANIFYFAKLCNAIYIDRFVRLMFDLTEMDCGIRGLVVVDEKTYSRSPSVYEMEDIAMQAETAKRRQDIKDKY